MFPVNFALIFLGGIPYPFIHLSIFRQTQIYPVYLVFPYSNYTKPKSYCGGYSYGPTNSYNWDELTPIT